MTKQIVFFWQQNACTEFLMRMQIFCLLLGIIYDIGFRNTIVVVAQYPSSIITFWPFIKKKRTQRDKFGIKFLLIQMYHQIQSETKGDSKSIVHLYCLFDTSFIFNQFMNIQFFHNSRSSMMIKC